MNIESYSYIVRRSDLWADALVRGFKDGKVAVTLVIRQDGQDITRNLYIAKYPDYLTKGKWKVQVTTSLDEIKSAKPLEGIFSCIFEDFAHEKDQPPVPKIEKKWAGSDDVAPFYTIIAKVVDGDYKGATITLKSQYDYFVPVQTVWKDKPVTVVGIKLAKGDQSSKHALNSLAFVESLNILDLPLPWSDNILPLMRQRALKATKDGKRLTISVENGYAKSIQRQSKLDKVDNEDDFFSEFEESTSTTAPQFDEPIMETDPFADAVVDGADADQEDDSLGEWEDGIVQFGDE